MGVTVHNFALDLGRWAEHSSALPTTDALLEAGIITDELLVKPAHSDWVTAIDALMDDNKKWYINHSADTIYSALRQHLTDPAERADHDALMRMLFWRPDPSPASDAQPQHAGDWNWVYPPELVQRICDRQHYNEWLLSEALRAAAADPARIPVDHAYLWEPSWFIWWLDGWLDLFLRVRAAGPKRSLLMWVWV